MKRNFIFLAIAFILSSAFYAHRDPVIPHVSPALRFTENLGQWDNNILFRAQLDGGALFVEKNCLTFNLYDKKKYRENHINGLRKEEHKNSKVKGHAYKLRFEGCNLNAQVEKFQTGSDYENFFIGNDKSKWKSNVKNYHQLFFKNLYNKIDYEVITAVNGLKYNFHVKPGANVADIKLKYEGVDKIKLKDGNLVLKLEINEVVEQKPYAYQIINGKVKEVPCNYVLKGANLSFEFPAGYNKSYDLIIDPLLVFAAQIGTVVDNFGMTATFDAAGNLYSGGIVFDVGYPTVAGSYDVTFNNVAGYGRTDVFITKYNATGNALLYSTYLGGSGTEVVSSLVVDYNNNLCMYGATSSPNFPMLANSAYPTFKGGPTLGFTSNGTIFCGGTDIFLAKFNATGTNLMASTYYGGTANDGINHLTNTVPDFVAANLNPCTTNFPTTNYDSLQTNYGDQFRGEIQVDVFNNIYITSSSRSADLPMVGGFDNTINGGQDAIVAKFDPSLNVLLYSSFIGGSQNDCGNGIFVDKNQEVYVTGGTCSNNLQGTSGGHISSYQGGKTDGFLYKILASGASIVNATYIGTASYDNSFFVQVDKGGSVYVYGQSLGNIPVQKHASAATVFSVSSTHQFIIMYNNGLTNVLMSTVFGNKTNGIDISPSAFAVDRCKNIYLSGWGGGIITNTAPMANMPLFAPTQASTAGYDFYLMALDSNATNLVYGSYFGGNSSQEHVDGGTSRFDPRGVIYQSVCAGCGGADDFPITPNTWPCPSSTTCPNQNPSSNCNNGVFKIDFQLKLAVSTINTNTIAGCNPLTVTFTNAAQPTSSLATSTWDFGNGTVVTTTVSPIVVTYTNPGTYTVSLVITDPTTCNIKDSSITYITVYPGIKADFTHTVVPCTDSVKFTNTSTTTATSYTPNWSFSGGGTSTSQNPIQTYSANGTYTAKVVAINEFGCRDSITKPFSIFVFTPSVSPNYTICEGESVGLSASGGTSYTWQPANSLSTPNGSNPTANPTVTTVYTVTIENNSSGPICSRTLTTEVHVNPKPNADFNYSVSPCGGSVDFYDASASNINWWHWDFSNGDTSASKDPFTFYNVGGTYTVSLFVKNIYGCSDTIIKSLTVATPPPVSVTPNVTVCLGGSTQLSASGGVKYEWEPSTSLNNPNISNPLATPSITTQYTVTIFTVTGVGDTCKFKLKTSVFVAQLSPINPLSIKADPDTIQLGSGTSLSVTGDAGMTVNWLPPNLVLPNTGYVVSSYPKTSTTYTAVINRGPCTATLTVDVFVYRPGCESDDVYVPNTFTPNNDGQNDILYARCNKSTEIYFAVYNRWGELVFETKDKNVGWDGNYKGRPADVGVFGYYVRFKCFNGEESFKKGNVTLIR